MSAGLAGGEAPEITCLYFTVQLADSPEVAIPDLKNWSYALDRTGTDEKGRYLFRDLPAGLYVVQIAADGYRPETKVR